ncbi:MAG: cobO [Firmicutes bacterium]|nr:cobO [Bacillota bacterium]
MMGKRGKVIVFTGDAKGKTTAALGLAVATASYGQRATVIQFLKGGGYTGELFAKEWLTPYLEIRQFGFGCPYSAAIKNGTIQCIQCGKCFGENRRPGSPFARQAFEYATQVVTAGESQVVVLDEISHALRHKLLAMDEVVSLLVSRPEGMTVVLTGRNMPDELLQVADEITECVPVKHPFESGIAARRGSEY